MAWRGFITESKLYMGYPGRNKVYRPNWGFRDLTPEEKRSAIQFWLRVPGAYCRFVWYGLRYNLRVWRHKWTFFQ